MASSSQFVLDGFGDEAAAIPLEAVDFVQQVRGKRDGDPFGVGHISKYDLKYDHTQLRAAPSAAGTHNFFGRMLHGRQVTSSGEDRLIKRMREAGLVNAVHTATRTTIFGPLAFYQASAPGS